MDYLIKRQRFGRWIITLSNKQTQHFPAKAANDHEDKSKLFLTIMFNIETKQAIVLVY